MKAKILILFVLSSSLSLLGGQNYTDALSVEEDWSCIYPAKKAYYENNNKEVYCIRVDSTFNNDSILYPFSDVHSMSWDCFSINSGSWLAKYIALDEQGHTIFRNGKNQPVLIKNKAAFNDRWEVFKNENIKVEGQITSISLKSVLNVEDSVKTISFAVYNPNDEPIEHELNHFSIEISKHLDLVKTVNFYYFEHSGYYYYTPLGEFDLIEIDDPPLGFQNVNLREKYFDFQAGDELHIWDLQDLFLSRNSDKKIIHRYLSRDDYLIFPV